MHCSGPGKGRNALAGQQVTKLVARKRWEDIWSPPIPPSVLRARSGIRLAIGHARLTKETRRDQHGHAALICALLSKRKLMALQLIAPPAAETPVQCLAAAARSPAAAHGNASRHAHSNGWPQCVHCARCHSPAQAAASAPDYR
jgi:hypothetical protein